MARVFISYSHQDSAFVKRLANDLRFLGVDLWVDTARLRIGDSLIERIREGIDEVQFVAAVISKNSVSSSWVQRELDVAMTQEIAGRRVKVLPLLLDDCVLPGFILGKVYADFRSLKEYGSSLARLVNQLETEFDPLPVVPLAGDGVHNSPSGERFKAEIYNRLAMKILEWASYWSPSFSRELAPVHWRQADDAATYACDIGNKELYDNSIKWMDDVQAAYGDMWFLFSPQSIAMREAVRLFIGAATLGDVEAIWNLGWRYELGQGVLQNHERAVYYWTAAAQRGHRAAMDKLAELGYTVPEPDWRSFSYSVTSAEARKEAQERH